MKPLATPFVLAAAVLAVLPARPALAQLEAASLRGTVTDADGKPLPDVKVELEYKGETRTRITRTLTTDKKGAYIRVGLKPGPWAVVYRKEGYGTKGLETVLSGGGVSEIPPVALSAAPSAAAAAPNAAAAPPPANERAKELSASYQKALDALRAGRNAEAEQLFRAVATELPTLPEARYNLGYLAAQRGDDAAAEAEFRKAIELQPALVESYLALATLLDRAKRGEEGLKLLQEAAPRFPADGRFQFALGAAAFNLGRNDEAEQAFLKAAAAEAPNAEAHFFLGSIALTRNDVPGAVKHLEAYVAVAPAGAASLDAAKALLETLKKKK